MCIYQFRRTGMCREFNLSVLGPHGRLAVSSTDWHAGHALQVVFVVLFVVIGASPARKTAAGEVAVQDALVYITGVDGGGRVGHEVVAHVCKGALHGGSLRLELPLINCTTFLILPGR